MDCDPKIEDESFCEKNGDTNKLTDEEENIVGADEVKYTSGVLNEKNELKNEGKGFSETIPNLKDKRDGSMNNANQADELNVTKEYMPEIPDCKSKLDYVVVVSSGLDDLKDETDLAEKTARIEKLIDEKGVSSKKVLKSDGMQEQGYLSEKNPDELNNEKKCPSEKDGGYSLWENEKEVQSEKNVESDELNNRKECSPEKDGESTVPKNEKEVPSEKNVESDELNNRKECSPEKDGRSSVPKDEKEVSSEKNVESDELNSRKECPSKKDGGSPVPKNEKVFPSEKNVESHELDNETESPSEEESYKKEGSCEKVVKSGQLENVKNCPSEENVKSNVLKDVKEDLPKKIVQPENGSKGQSENNVESHGIKNEKESHIQESSDLKKENEDVTKKVEEPVKLKNDMEGSSDKVEKSHQLKNDDSEKVVNPDKLKSVKVSSSHKIDESDRLKKEKEALSEKNVESNELKDVKVSSTNIDDKILNESKTSSENNTGFLLSGSSEKVDDEEMLRYKEHIDSILGLSEKETKERKSRLGGAQHQLSFQTHSDGNDQSHSTVPSYSDILKKDVNNMLNNKTNFGYKHQFGQESARLGPAELKFDDKWRTKIIASYKLISSFDRK